jgi:hypothetical protein
MLLREAEASRTGPLVMLRRPFNIPGRQRIDLAAFSRTLAAWLEAAPDLPGGLPPADDPRRTAREPAGPGGAGVDLAGAARAGRESSMFLLYLIALYVVVPTIMILAVVMVPIPLRLGITFVLFPAALIAFALWRHVREGRRLR